jgi:C-methyltransferase C-terminal domain/Putative zinc binding domain
VELVLDLGPVPRSDTFPDEHDPGPDPSWPLELYTCPECALVQLGPFGPLAVDEQGAVESATGRAHAKRSVEAILRAEGLGHRNTVIEIDSGHGGSWLPGFVAAGLVPLGPHVTADLVVDLHGLMHEQDLDAAVAAHAARIAPGGRLICEFYYLGALVEGSLIDTIRHGHFSYLSLVAASRLFAAHGLVVCRAERVPMFGGSLRLTAQHKADVVAIDDSVAELCRVERAANLDGRPALAALGNRGRAAALALRELLASATERGVTVVGYGAPSKAAVLLALAGVDATLLPYTVDLAPAKHGSRIPGAFVPIRPVETLVDNNPDEVVVLTWDIADEVIKQLKGMASGTNWKPQFWVPLPVPGYVSP